MPSDPQALRLAGTVALAEYFARLADRSPVLIQLEDLHWADDGSLRWLEAADAALHDKPVLVVATARPQLREERPLWGRDADQQPLDHHTRMWLQPLGPRRRRASSCATCSATSSIRPTRSSTSCSTPPAATPSTSRSW